MSDEYSIPTKANRVLNFILLSLLLIFIRVWYLSVVQREEHVQQARRPQRRSTIEHVERGSIRDRFNIPLALNRVQYNAAIHYADLRQIPSITWTKDAAGKRVKTQARLAYIAELAQLLSQELAIDPSRIEDLIHSKASLFPHISFVIKEDISEGKYYRLKMLEKDWPGLSAERGSKRFYPQGKTGCDIIGYMGSISQREHLAIAQEIKELKSYLEEREMGETPFLPKGFSSPIEVRQRLKALQEKSYTIHDFVGKAGIEAALDEQLRGFYAKKIYEVDVKGNILRELPGARKPVSGQRVILSISSELQAFTESLLAYNESKEGDKDLSSPWIKGGAIVVMDPRNGEVLALASHPRFNPEDFIPTQNPSLRGEKQSAILRWLENEAYISEIWDGVRPLEREGFSMAKKEFVEENLPLTWEHYLESILPLKSPARTAVDRIGNLKSAIRLQEAAEDLLALSGQSDMRALIQMLYSDSKNIAVRTSLASEQKEAIEAALYKEKSRVLLLKRDLDDFLEIIPHNDDKLLVLDLVRLLVHRESFSTPLVQAVGEHPLFSFRAFSQEASLAEAKIRPLIQEFFHQNEFKKWREQHFKAFLRLKRKEEKESKKYPRPYIEYLDLLEKKMFQEFWQKHRFHLLASFLTRIPVPELKEYLSALPTSEPTTFSKVLIQLGPLASDYLGTMRSFKELTRPLWGSYRGLRKTGGKFLEKHLAAAFYPMNGYGYGRSQAYRQSTPQGSVFKLVVAYEALKEKYAQLLEKKAHLEQLNPLTLIDDLKWASSRGSASQILGYRLNGEPITRMYKGGRLPQSSHPHIGKVDLTGAIEQSSNIYFSLLAHEIIEDPSVLAQTTRQFGFGEKTGIELPGEIAGSVPGDLAHNLTGLYAFAIGQHSLVVTPLQTAVMLSSLVNQGEILKPKIVQVIAGKEPFDQIDLLFSAAEFRFKEDLSLVGIHFPLFTETQTHLQRPYVSCAPKEVKQTLFYPEEIRQILLDGMQRVVSGARGTARPAALRKFTDNPQVMRDYIDLQNQFIGKTGTAEILYKHTIDAQTHAKIEKHVWFTGISFSEPLNSSFQAEPELVIVAYLRFGEGGKEAALLVSQIVKKWRQIRSNHSEKI